MSGPQKFYTADFQRAVIDAVPPDQRMICTCIKCLGQYWARKGDEGWNEHTASCPHCGAGYVTGRVLKR